MPDSKKKNQYDLRYICRDVALRGNLGSGTVELKFRTLKNLAVYGA